MIDGAMIIFLSALLYLICYAVWEGWQWLQSKRRERQAERRGFPVEQKKKPQ